MKQQQKLTPQQLLLARLLQIPSSELEQNIKEEIERNPLLEETEPAHDDADDSLSYDSPGDAEADMDFDDNENEYFSDDDDYAYREEHASNYAENYADNSPTSPTSFLEYLSGQFELLPATPREKAIGAQLIGNIDDAGYLARDINLIVNDLAFRQGLEVSLQEVETVLQKIQTLEPIGVGARTLQECLSIQLHHLPKKDSAYQLATVIVDKHFETFSRHRLDKLCSLLNVKEDELDEAVSIIRHLSPKPGSAYNDSALPAHYIIPDFIVSRNGDMLSFTLNEHRLPELQVSPYYSNMLQQLTQSKKPSPSEKETIQFLKDRSESAQQYIVALKERRRTLESTMQIILDRQRDYFLYGDSTKLKPLLQKDVAAASGLDISTISRVVNQKYVQTDFGTFLLKDLFSQSITNNEGEEIATEAVRHILTEAIQNEDKSSPLTDEQLAALLNEKGFPIARRTVAKYRDMLDIPVCRLRKNYHSK